MIDYIKPIIYYLISFFINLYIYFLLSILFYSIFTILLLSINVFNEKVIYDLIHNINFVFIAGLMTLLIYKVSNFYVIKNMKK